MTTAHQWRDCGLIPTSGLEAWHMYEAGASGHHIIYDYSGNSRIIDSAETDAAVLSSNVLYGQPGWYFNGSTTVPLNYTGSVTVKHAFILAAHDDATFNLNRGLLTGETAGDILVSDSSGTKFFDLSGTTPDMGYRKSDVFYASANQQAPMSNVPELLEVASPVGFTLDGIQIGKQRNLAGKIWKGYFFEQLLYSRILTTNEKDRIKLYFNIKFAQWRRGVPFYFPSADLVPTIGPTRFLDVPRDYAEITDSWEYEDATKDFNEVADDAPRRWEYAYTAVPKAEKVIFDEFWNQARHINPFYFRDPDGILWSNVRVEEYRRNHEAHKRWKHEVPFRLVGYNSVGVEEFVDETAPEEVPDGALAFGGDHLLFGGDFTTFTP
jgi:hypothetical protein